MTAKEFVLNTYPTAKSEKHKTNGVFGETYWLIRMRGAQMYFSEGETESKAWKNAKEKIESQTEENF